VGGGGERLKKGGRTRTQTKIADEQVRKGKKTHLDDALRERTEKLSGIREGIERSPYMKPRKNPSSRRAYERGREVSSILTDNEKKRMEIRKKGKGKRKPRSRNHVERRYHNRGRRASAPIEIASWGKREGTNQLTRIVCHHQVKRKKVGRKKKGLLFVEVRDRMRQVEGKGRHFNAEIGVLSCSKIFTTQRRRRGARGRGVLCCRNRRVHTARRRNAVARF